jgi:predicted MFS family arabinose efflux permease
MARKGEQVIGSSPARALFLCMFGGQAAFLVLAPILTEMSRELGVATATAGQLRLVSGAAGGVAALALGPLARRFDLRALLTAGLSLLAGGSLASAAAPGFVALAGAQLAVGSGLGIVVSSTITAASEWASPARRAHVLSWALLGQPAAWVIGMPAIGAVAEISWRLTWIGLPLLASLLALVAVRRRPAAAPASELGVSWSVVWRDRAVAGWALGELLAFAAWGGTLVFSGALFAESYGLSAASVGLLLALGASAYFPGSFLVRRYLDRAARPLLIGFGLALAAGIALFGTVRPSAIASAALFAALVFLAGGRTLAASAIGLEAAPEHRMAVTSIRAAATQFGYLLGVAVAGIALAAGGYMALGVSLAALLATGTVVPGVIGLGSGWPPTTGIRPTAPPGAPCAAPSPTARSPMATRRDSCLMRGNRVRPSEQHTPRRHVRGSVAVRATSSTWPWRNPFAPRPVPRSR